jgi:hypothetical protein
MKIIVHADDEYDAAEAIFAFREALSDEACRTSLARPRGLIGIRFAGRYWSVSRGRSSYTVRESK